MASQITANDKIGKFQGRGETTVFSFDKEPIFVNKISAAKISTLHLHFNIFASF